MIATNAKLTKTDANRVAQVAHDGLARSIAPAHTPGDGDTLFVLATGAIDAPSLLVVGELAAQAVAEAVLRAVREATGVEGYPRRCAISTPSSLDEAARNGVVDQRFRVLPELGRALAHGLVARDHLIARDAVLAPGAAAGRVVVEHGLQTVERGGEARLGRRARVELLPQAAQLGREVRGEEREQSIGGAPLALVLVEDGGLVVAEGVAGVDLDEIVDQHHLEDAGQVEPGRPVLGEQHRHHGEVPGMLGGVLAPRPIEDPGPSQDALELVDLEDEPDLRREPVGPTGSLRSRVGHGSSLPVLRPEPRPASISSRLAGGASVPSAWPRNFSERY